jgi:hypothetical protein
MPCNPQAFQVDSPSDNALSESDSPSDNALSESDSGDGSSDEEFHDVEMPEDNAPKEVFQSVSV